MVLEGTNKGNRRGLSLEYNSNFRYDLKRGQDAEKWLGGLLEADTLEVKRDFKASRTKRVFVEYESRGKPSGVSTSEADYWAFILDDAVIMLPLHRLKRLVDIAIDDKRVANGGDKNTSKGALIDIDDLTKTD